MPTLTRAEQHPRIATANLAKAIELFRLEKQISGNELARAYADSEGVTERTAYRQMRDIAKGEATVWQADHWACFIGLPLAFVEPEAA